MTAQGAKTADISRRWRRAVAGGAVAIGLAVAFGPAVAYAEPVEPADPATQTEEPKPQTADEVLAIIARDYDTGAGGGQLSNLIHAVLKLRAQGIMPSQANRDAIVKALDYRPNQTPLVNALQDTLAYQQKKFEQMQEPSGNPTTIGINQYDPDNPGVLGTFGITPGGSTINEPVG